MINIQITYEGSLRTQATHGPSQNQLITDAPADNHGKGESFSPTDLVATALGSCMATIMGIVANRDGLDMSSLKVSVDKEMVADPERRIGKLTVVFDMPAGLDAKSRTKLENAAKACPVHKSLDPRVETPFTFNYPD